MSNELQALKTLAWEVNDLQSDLIELGNRILRETGSFQSWVRSHLLGRSLPFHELSIQASTLVGKFNAQEVRLRTSEVAASIPHGYSEFYDLLLSFTGALKESAVILAENQAAALEGAEGKKRVSFAQVREGSIRYNRSMSRYMEVAASLQPHLNQLFDEPVA